MGDLLQSDLLAVDAMPTEELGLETHAIFGSMSAGP
jgi:hypothetical protein